MTELWNQFQTALGGSLPNLLGALGILVVGWLIATVVAKLVRAGLKRTRFDDKLAALFRGRELDPNVDVGRWIAQGIFYVLMVFVIIAVLQALHLTMVTEPLSALLTRTFEFLPRVLGAAVLLLVAWVAATVLRRIVSGALGAARIDEKVSQETDGKSLPLAASIGEAVYWLVFLLFLPAVLGAMELEGILRPVQNMFDDVLGYLPNVMGAVLIGLVGWFVAGIVRRIVTNLLAAAGADRLGEKVGIRASAEHPISNSLGLIVYVVILVPVLISALNALHLSAITEPASRMLYVAFDAVPMILAAAVVLALAYFVGKLLSTLVTNLLEVAGFDRLLHKMGLVKADGDTPMRTYSSMVGTLVMVAAMVFAVIEAAKLLGFTMVGEMAAQFLVFASQVLLGLVILAIGFYLANLAARTLRASGGANAMFLARAAQISIVLLTAAIGLRRMGLANDIINMAFGLLIGAVAIAVAIAFGIGGREVAANQLRGWLNSAKNDQ